MEPNWNNTKDRLEYRHIEHPTKEALKYIDSRRKGIVKSLKTRWKKFNKLTNGGVEPGVITTIAGASGSGKTAFAGTLAVDLVDLNPDQDFVILNFSFEMIGYRSIGRFISYKARKTTNELYSGDQDNVVINDDEFSAIEKHGESIKQYPIYFVDSPGNVDQIKNTIETFRMTVARGKWLVIMLDHTLLVRGKTSQGEREVLGDLQKLFMEVKKWGRVSIIQLTQLNRNIEASERISNPSLHYPRRSDLSSSDTMFHASDFVFVIHRPETIGIEKYGLSNLPTKDVVYLHCLKARDGEAKILVFKNNLKYNSIDEISINEL